MAYGVPYVRWLACGGYMSYHTVARKRLKRCVARHREALREEAELARRPGEHARRSRYLGYEAVDWDLSRYGRYLHLHCGLRLILI
jgi:hypothetical protein